MLSGYKFKLKSRQNWRASFALHINDLFFSTDFDKSNLSQFKRNLELIKDHKGSYGDVDGLHSC